MAEKKYGITPAQMIAEENSAAANNTVNTNEASQEKAEAIAEEKAKLMVRGFIFSNPEDAELARQELKNIDYLEQKMNYHMPENILSVYNKVLENKMFKTPLGWDYLHKMQLNMLKLGIDPHRIAPIPIFNNFVPKTTPGVVNEGIARQRIERRLKIEKTEAAKMKTRFTSAVYVCLLLGAVIIAMFYITWQSENPTILNYERTLVNKYSEWEQDLKERELEIRAKELELNLNTE
jgi:hypothetical protein